MFKVIPFTKEERKLKVIFAKRLLEGVSKGSYLWHEDRVTPLAVMRYEKVIQELEENIKQLNRDRQELLDDLGRDWYVV